MAQLSPAPRAGASSSNHPDCQLENANVPLTLSFLLQGWLVTVRLVLMAKILPTDHTRQLKPLEFGCVLSSAMVKKMMLSETGSLAHQGCLRLPKRHLTVSSILILLVIGRRLADGKGVRSMWRV